MSFPLAVVFLIGLCVGSFLNAVIYRLPRRESFITGRSRCPLCGHTLAWYDLLPLLSFLILLGRCRYCRAVISPRYPLIELLTGALFALLYLSFGLTAAFVKYAFFAAFLIVVSMIDLEHYIVPDRLVTAGLAGGILLGVLSRDRGLFSALLGAGVAAGFLLLVALLSKGGMGGGDIKLAFVTGLFLGWPLGPLGIFLRFLPGGHHRRIPFGSAPERQEGPHSLWAVYCHGLPSLFVVGGRTAGLVFPPS